MNRNDENDEHSCSGLRLVSEVIPHCIRQILAAGQHYENICHDKSGQKL